ncbi:MAG: hypothetical protein EP329_00790 [Deltaproteobacteria bacterium]|nr:MAG: hypothetical protein EP329_00790 [Deltaproteobacteria bacterium]
MKRQTLATTALALALLASGCGGETTTPAAEVDSAGPADASDAAEPDDTAGADVAPDSGAAQDSAGADAASVDTATFDPGPEPCDEVNAFAPVFGGDLLTWNYQDGLGGWPEDPVVFTGSSSIRRWEGLAAAYTDYAPLQRGFGGAQLAEVARYADKLIVRHAPRAVVVYAGTNDLSAGVAVDVVVERLRCLRWRIGDALGWELPVLFVGVTPNPARWDDWSRSRALNDAAAALAAGDPGLVFVDVAPPFLALGEPPPADLFVADGLHLSASGYALWDSVLRPAVEAAVSPRPAADAPSPAVASGARVLVDLGPIDDDDGEASPSPDYLGQHWNNWHTLPGGAHVLPGEQRVDLVTTAGDATGIDLVVAGGFLVNGRRNGGLLWPDGALLGDLAVGSATGDFFYVDGPDNPGALFLRGLDPVRTYTLRLFAARDDAATRKTRYTVTGAETASATLQTSGSGAGAAGATTNDDSVAAFTGVRPDAWGHVFVDVAIAEGDYAYLSLLELTVE